MLGLIKIVQKHKLVFGLIIVALFAAARGVNYYNTFLKWDYYVWSDEAIYAILASRILNGDIVGALHPYWNIGFSLTTIPFYLLTKSWETAQMLVSISAVILLIFVMYFTFGKISRSLGILAAFVVAFFPALAKLVLVWGGTEPLYILLLWAAIFFCWKTIETQKLFHYFWAGTFMGLAYLTRTDASYTLVAFFMFLLLSLFFEKRKFSLGLRIVNPITVSAFLFAIIGYVYWIISSTKLFTKTSINFHPTASFIALFCFLGVVAVFGVAFKLKDKLKFSNTVKTISPKIAVFALMFFLINLPNIIANSMNLGKFTMSGKYSFIISGHSFTPERDRLTTFAQDIWSLDYPNYHSPYYDSTKVYKKFLSNLDTAWEFYPKKLKTYIEYYGYNNLLTPLDTLLMLTGIVVGLLRKKLLKLTTFLLFVWIVSLLFVTMFMGPTQRYIAFSYPIVIAFQAIALWGVSSFVSDIFKYYKLNKLKNKAFILTALMLCLIYFGSYYNLSDLLKGQGGSGNKHQKVIGEWLRSNNIQIVMARTEGISFYSGAKLVYMPAAPPDVIIQFAKAWGVEYLISRPVESSWPYMKIMVDPKFKHKDLTLVHSFYEGSLVWKVSLTDEEKRYNYRTGKPIAVFCRSNEWSRSDDPSLPSCPDRTY